MKILTIATAVFTLSGFVQAEEKAAADNHSDVKQAIKSVKKDKKKARGAEGHGGYGYFCFEPNLYEATIDGETHFIGDTFDQWDAADDGINAVLIKDYKKYMLDEDGSLNELGKKHLRSGVSLEYKRAAQFRGDKKVPWLDAMDGRWANVVRKIMGYNMHN